MNGLELKASEISESEEAFNFGFTFNGREIAPGFTSYGLRNI